MPAASPAAPKEKWKYDQPKYVNIPFEEEKKDYLIETDRPRFEKMPSCDLSVEATPTTNVNSEEEENKMYQDSLGFFSKKPIRDIYEHLSPFVELDEKEATLKKIELEEDWKVGAIENTKSRSPTEHDDRDDVSSLLQNKLQANLEVLEVEENKSTVDNGPVICKQLLPLKTKPKHKEKHYKGPLKRQSIGKKKRNKWVILCPEPQKPSKKKKIKLSQAKKTCTSKPNLKHDEQIDMNFDDPSEVKTTVAYSSSSTKMVHSGSSVNKCEDSGVSTGSSNSSGSGDSGSEGYDLNNGGCGGGNGGAGGGGNGGGFHGKGGMGGSGRDDDKRPFSSEDTEMKEEDEDEDEEDVKMKSKSCSDMDTRDNSIQKHSTVLQNLPCQTQHLQHSCYCSKNDCDRPFCLQTKTELEHFNKNDFQEDCQRCKMVMNLLKMHAAMCQRHGCRVPLCGNLRKNNEVMKHVPKERCSTKFQPVSNKPPNIDGKVVFKNSTMSINGDIFQENMDYLKGEMIGKGANGDVYKVQFPPGSQLSKIPIVVKETKYQIQREEVDVYQNMGEHKNIVDHYCVTMRGNNGCACVFMEKCDKSLKDIYEDHPMDTNEVMFYWTQVLAAVEHLHVRNIIHKDIKAMNVLVSKVPGQGEGFRAKLADFDSAKMLKAEFTLSGLKPMGTSGFVAPEVLNKDPHGRPADIYSLGCLLLELTGFTPKQDLLEQQIQNLFEKDQRLGRLVFACVQQDYRKRPTARQIIDELGIPEQV